MKQNYVIIDDDQNSVLETRAVVASFQNLVCVGFASNYDDGLNLILEHKPEIVFLEIDPQNSDSNLSLQIINELHRYLKIIPKIFITTKSKEYALEAIRYDVFDYFVKPLNLLDLRKSILRYEKQIGDQQIVISTEPNSHPCKEEIELQNHIIDSEIVVDDHIVIAENQIVTEHAEQNDRSSEYVPTQVQKPLIICVKSYGDYRFIDAKDICYLQADNNSTDIHLQNGEMITAFKTLKYFELLLKLPFIRIHNSYIANIDFISRIHTGNAVCYIKNATLTKLPFSKSYKENVDCILATFASGPYIEI